MIMPGYQVYPESLRRNDDNYFFIVKDNKKKYLVVSGKESKKFEGEFIAEGTKLSSLNHNNAELLKEIFPELSPVPSNLRTSFGFGDRLGLATPAHIECVRKHNNVFPVFAQQSARELRRTGRNMQSVIDTVIWGYVETGYKGLYGADADHLKDISLVNQAIKTGFSMFTIDPSNYINNPSRMSAEEQKSCYSSLPEVKDIERFFLNKEYSIAGKRYLFTESELKRIIITFVKGLNFAVDCYKTIKNYRERFDFEISIDEIGIPTTFLDHIFITEYLRKNGVLFTSLALCFPGEFQKAIDYRGNIEEFKKSYQEHYLISQSLGNYKLCLHSGSDKFSVYPIISEVGDTFHIKTAGTSWLQAIKTIALKNPSLYRKIHKSAIRNIEKDRASYSIGLDLDKILPIEKIADKNLGELFSLPDARQLIHITYGSVLSEFREEIYRSLFISETEHYHLVEEHLNKHLNLLE